MYLLDSNVFINAARLYYAPDIAPPFWGWVKQKHCEGCIASIIQVKKEIDDGKTGYLRQWADNLPKSFWLQPDEPALHSSAQLAEWVSSPDRPYSEAAKKQFLQVADFFLVAFAHSGNHQVVTFEKSAPNAKKRVLIPDACDGMGVRYRDPFEVYRELGLRFH